MSLQRRVGRTTGFLLKGTLGLSLLFALSPAVRADDEAPGQKTEAPVTRGYDIELVDAKLSSAIRFIEQKTGISLVFTQPNFQYDTITLSLKNKSIDVLMKQLARAAGADIWQDGGIYYVGPKGSGPQVIIEKPTAVPTDDIFTPVGFGHIEKIKMQYTNANVMLRRLGIRRGKFSEDFLDQWNEMNYALMLSHAHPSNNPITAPFTILTGDRTGGAYTPSTGNQVAPAVPVGGRSENIPRNSPFNNGVGNFSSGGNGDQGAHRDGDGSGNVGSGGTVERAGQFGGGGGQFGGGGGQFGGGGGQFGGGGGQLGGGGGGGQLGGGQGQGQGGQQNGQGAAQNLVPPPFQPGDLSALDADNSIIVHIPAGGEAAFRDLREIIRLLDVKPRQIMIRAEFVTVTSNLTNAFGINWAFQKVNLIGGVSTGFSSTNTAFLQYATGNLQTQLSFILTSGQGKVVAAPMASTLNGVNVTFNQTTTVPVFLSTPIVSPGGTTVISQQVIPIPVTTGLSITPLINGDESISLTGFLQSSSIGAPIVSPDGSQSFPNITNQNVPVNRIVRNGDTLVIAGLTSKNDQLIENKVPLLGDLPLLGNLFRSHAVTTADNELLVFITPTIIPERQSNATIGGGAGIPGGAVPGAVGGGVVPGGAQ